MMKRSKGPVILLVSLSLVLFFILGVRYGQRVEKQNKEVETLLKTSPPISPQPTVVTSFKKYESAGCNLEFVYPASYTLLKEQDESVSFSTNREDAGLAFSCEKDNPFSKLQTDKVATEEVQFQQKPLQAKSALLNGQKYLFFSLRNPVSAKDVYFIVEENLYPLIEGSLKFRNIPFKSKPGVF